MGGMVPHDAPLVAVSLGRHRQTLCIAHNRKHCKVKSILRNKSCVIFLFLKSWKQVKLQRTTGQKLMKTKYIVKILVP